MTDQTLEHAVLSALCLEPSINTARILVTVHDGVVTLTGEVGAHSQKLAAKYKAACVRGIKSVVDELEVTAHEKPSRGFDDIAASVLNALYWDCAVPPDRVSAKCERGWVTLSGEVDRAYQKSSAEADVRNVRGVVGVTNEITVASSAKTEASRRDEAMLLAGAIGPIAEERKRAEGRRASLS